MLKISLLDFGADRKSQTSPVCRSIKSFNYNNDNNNNDNNVLKIEKQYGQQNWLLKRTYNSFRLKTIFKRNLFFQKKKAKS